MADPFQLTAFRVTNFRNIHDSGWVNIHDLTAFIGPNESGKSNLCEALFRLKPFDGKTTFDINFDWPVDLWEKKDPKAIAISARFKLTETQRNEYIEAARKPPSADETTEPLSPNFKGENSEVVVQRSYDGKFYTDYALKGDFEPKTAWSWLLERIPQFVYVDDYGATGTQVELDQLAQRMGDWNSLSPQDQTIKIILDLAKIEISDFLNKGTTIEGRTLRTFDKKNASAYLSRKFSDLWKQKKVDFDIEIDATTLNILVRDEGLHMPVPLNRRSTGFRWYVAFAWRFTHATQGNFKGTVLLLEEPGIHLHPAAQADLLRVFEDLSRTNQLIYTTHVPSLVDPGFPERIRIVELERHHTKVTEGLVTSSRSPMMVIESSLGLSPEMSGLLGRRKTLIVEGQDDSTVLWKLSKLCEDAGKACIPEDVYLWPAQGAMKSPMYVGFLIGHEWKGGVLLDSDDEGRKAKDKIRDLYDLPEAKFFVCHLSDAIGDKDSFQTIEDVLGPKFYLNAVGETYRLRFDESDLDANPAFSMVRQIEGALKKRGMSGLDKGHVMTTILKTFSSWRKFDDLPEETQRNAEKLFSYLQSKISKLN